MGRPAGSAQFRALLASCESDVEEAAQPHSIADARDARLAALASARASQLSKTPREDPLTVILASGNCHICCWVLIYSKSFLLQRRISVIPRKLPRTLSRKCLSTCSQRSARFRMSVQKQTRWVLIGGVWVKLRKREPLSLCNSVDIWWEPCLQI